MSLTPAYIVLALSSVGLCVVALLAARERRKPSPLLRDRRIIEDMAHGDLLKAAGACLHVPGLAAPSCDCRMGRPW